MNNENKISHGGAERLLEKYMESKGWKVVKDKRFRWQRHEYFYRPDRAFMKDQQVILAEVKPGSVGWQDTQKGIGQVITALQLDGIYSLLLVPDKYKERLRVIFSRVDDAVGLFTFNRAGIISVVRWPGGKDTEVVIPEVVPKPDSGVKQLQGVEGIIDFVNQRYATLSERKFMADAIYKDKNKDNPEKWPDALKRIKEAFDEEEDHSWLE